MRKLKVFYTPKQAVESNDSFSPSAGKPAKVVKSWLNLTDKIEIVAPSPLCAAQIALAHDPAYVHGVLSCKAPNGFGNTLPEVARSLPYTTGSLVAAATWAAHTGDPAVSPTSGFHHAGYEHGGGFCTFNGLVIAAQMLRLNGCAKKIGILDLDMHYGDGTQNIIDKLGLDYIRHYTFGGEDITKNSAQSWVEKLYAIVCKFRDCDVLLFQAGADPHVFDPLGGVLTSEQMRLRDLSVFKAAKSIGLPVAWNLAGGYQDPLRKVLDIHDATLMECLKVYTKGEK